MRAAGGSEGRAQGGDRLFAHAPSFISDEYPLSPAGDSGVRVHASCTIEIEGEEKPALVAETLILALG